MHLLKVATIASFFIASSIGYVASDALHGGEGDDVDEVDVILTEEKPGTFLIASVDYEDAAHSGPEETLNIMIGDYIYELDDVDNDWKNNEGLESGQEVTVPPGVALGAKSGKAKINGAKIVAKGDDDDDDGKKKKKNKKGLFDRNLLEEGRTEEQQRNVDQLRRHLYSTTTGQKTVVAVRVQANDAVYSNSEDVLRREVFGINSDGSIGDNFNLASGYGQCSFGAIQFQPRPSLTRNGVTINNGVVTIAVNINAEGNDDGNVRNKVTEAIRAKFGSDMTAVADYWMYCLPPGTSGGWIAYAYINSYISVYNNNWCNYPSGQIHEIGHNLNFAHSGEGAEYDDQVGNMGYSYSEDEGPVMCFNAAKSWQTGWYGPNGMYGDKTLTMSFGDDCLVTTLSGIADYDSTANKVLVKIFNPDNNGKDIFVAFNAKKGINSGTVEGGDQVTVVQVEKDGGSSYSKSDLLSKLSGGGVYTNTNFGSQKLTVAVDSISESDSASVRIYFDDTCVADPTPPPTPMPIPAGNSGPQIASYDPTLGAPKCSFGSSCDSAGLLDGRGQMTNGFEPGQPNTMNSCTDGNSGSYHGDESIDKIVVSQAPGNPNDMTVGDTVTISATVWCWSTGSSDHIDFYYASDASNPVWIQIGSRQTCPGGGSQTVTESYVLPAGGPIQAVRVNMMYGSGSVSASKCTSGNYDDTDDLAITVKATQPVGPTPPPTPEPSKQPTPAPTSPPTAPPTPSPTSNPTPQPSAEPTSHPTAAPTPSPTQNPTPQPTADPTPEPSNAPTPVPSNAPTPVPSNAPTSQPSPLPTTANPTETPTNEPTPIPTTANPTETPTDVPTNAPTTASPTNPPVVGPTPPPTHSPTSNPTPNPTTSNPTSNPTETPSPPPTSSPTSTPTHVPTSSPTLQPTAQPVATSAPTSSPTPAPELTKTLICGRGDIPDKPCSEGLEGTATVDEEHEVRCCRDCTNINCSKPWKEKCPDYAPDLFAISKVDGVCKVGTFSEALKFCRNIEGVNARLCTPLEMKNSCSKGTGCKFDQHHIWSCAYDGHACTTDAECCGSCNADGFCEGEFNLFPRQAQAGGGGLFAPANSKSKADK